MKLIKNGEIKDRSDIVIIVDNVTINKPSLRQLFADGWRVYITSIDNPVIKIKKICLSKINEFDKSKDVNSFFIGETQAWIDRDTRVSLMNSTQILKNSGQENTTLWLNGQPITISCDSLIQMLGMLEIYALQCYNVTEQHKANVNNLETVEEIKNYDFKVGYPEKLVFNV